MPSCVRSTVPTPNTVDEHGATVELNLVMDDYAADKHAKVKEWLAAHPCLKVHVDPRPWMHGVEVWFSLVERQAVRRRVCESVPDLDPKLRACIEGWNRRGHPFVRTKTAEEILKKANLPRTSNPRQ